LGLKVTLRSLSTRIRNFISWYFQGDLLKALHFKIVQTLYKDGCMLREVQGSLMLLCFEEGSIYSSAQNAYIAYGVREPLATEIYSKILKAGMHVVDVGTHVGYYALLASRLVGDEGVVYTIEPNPWSFLLLRYNVKLNGRKNIKLYNLAIGDEDGEIAFCYSVKYSNLSQVLDEDECRSSGGRPIRVRVTTLDQLLGEERVDVIRMDVEGFEYKILQGARKLLSRNKEMWFFLELHPSSYISRYGGSVEELLKFLKDFGFVVKYFIIEHPVPTNRQRPVVLEGEIHPTKFISFLKRNPDLFPHVFFVKK